MIYRNEHYKKAKDFDRSALQTFFPSTKPVYHLNKVSNVLEKTDDVVDIQALVNSSRETALDRTLARFMPEVQEPFAERQSIMLDDLEVMQEAHCLAEEYREKYNLPQFKEVDVNGVKTFVPYTSQDVFNYVSEQANNLAKRNEQFVRNNTQNVSENSNKEIKENESTQSVEKKEQSGI